MFLLHDLGWNSFFQQQAERKRDSAQPQDLKTGDSRLPARIIEEQRSAYRVLCEAGELSAEIAGHLRHTASGRSDLPVIGDWVLIDARIMEGRATIHGVLPRISKFSRKAAGQETTEQLIAANIDIVFLMTSLNADLNVRRIERYLATVWESGAQPVILLNKADLCDNAVAAIEEVASVAIGVPVHALSAFTGEGLGVIREYLKPGRTIAVLGSSGVGKSTLINRLLGTDVQSVREIREDDARGRHTTTARRLFLLSDGGMLIDTPGMRELQLWDVGDGLSQTFDDIQSLAQDCRFRDCSHESEPGCMVRLSLDSQQLSPERFESYLKLRRELKHLERKQDVLARIEEKRRWKRIHKAVRKSYKQRDKP